MLAPAAAATVLIVEDDPSVRELYRHALVSSRYQVFVAGDGLAALHPIDNDSPDVLILDLGLPRVSGWDVYRDLRSRPPTNKLPIIIVTANELRDIRLQDISAFLQKPVDPFRLVGAVDDALGRR